jgi:GxxExxY protein
MVFGKLLTEKLRQRSGARPDLQGASRNGRNVRKGTGQMSNENDLAAAVLDAAFKIHTKLGPGLLESAYETILAYELAKAGLQVVRQVPIPIRYEELTFEEGFRADLLVGGRLIVELKSVEKLSGVHAKQVITQLRLSGHRLGLLINFGEAHLKDGIKRIANELVD